MNATTEERSLIHQTDIAGMYILPGFDSSVSGWVTPPEVDEVETGSASAPISHSIVTWLRNGEILGNLAADWESALDLHAGPDHFECRFFEYPGESSTVILVDVGEAEDASEAEFDAEYQKVINDLRNGGRELLAQDVFQMLSDSQENPENVNITLLSLQSMARFLIRQKDFDDPIVGKDPYGIVQIEWHIIGNGLLVLAFLDDYLIHCVAQADTTSESEMLNESVRITERQFLEEFGHLVPLRQSQYRRSVT